MYTPYSVISDIQRISSILYTKINLTRDNRLTLLVIYLILEISATKNWKIDFLLSYNVGQPLIFKVSLS